MVRSKVEMFSIRQVIELTGISEFTLRGWENRYGAFTPDRTTTGRRRYTLDDIKKARLLQELLVKNHRIGDIAPLSTSKLELLIPMNALTKEAPPQNDLFLPSKQVVAVFDKALQFKWEKTRELLNKKRKATKTLPFILEYVLPVMNEMGRLVGQGQFSIAQEHILSSLIKEQLVLARASSAKSSSKAKLVMTTPEGDLHDLGLTIVSALASSLKIHTLFLGPSTPKKDLCETCLRYGATHVLISSTVSEKEGAKESLQSYINFLDRNLPQNMTILTGGRNSSFMKAKLSRPHYVFQSMTDFIQHLELIK